MEIRNYEFPPNYGELDEKFGLANQAVLFCWGNLIYNPLGVPLPKYIIKHEEVHSRQQADYGIQEWWDRYILDVPFRLAMELPAHRVEWEEYCKRHADSKKRNAYLSLVATRLSSPLYGEMESLEQARHLILTYKE